MRSGGPRARPRGFARVWAPDYGARDVAPDDAADRDPPPMPEAHGRTDGLAALALGLLCLALQLHVAHGFAVRGALDQFDVLFDADTGSRLECMTTDRCGDRSSFAHPALAAFVNPPVRLAAAALQAAGVVDGEAWEARRLVALGVAPLASALQTLVVFFMLRALGLGRGVAASLTLVNALAFSHLVFGSLPESFALSGLALSLAALLAAREMNGRPVPRPLWIAVGVFAAGITVTNFVAVALLFAATRLALRDRVRVLLLEGVLLGVVVASAVAMIGIASAPLYDLRDVDPGGGVFFTRQWLHEEGRVDRAFHLIGIFAATFAAPEIEERENPSALGRHSRYVTMFEVPVRPFGWLASPGALAMLGLLAAGAVGLARGPRPARFMLGASLALLAFNALLHTFWGSGLILYSQHWQIALVVLLAGLGFWPAFSSRAPRALALGFGVLALALAAGNARALAWMHAALDAPRTAGIAAAAGRDLPDLVLVVLDTVRADHMSAYGYERETSPRFDALARRGRLFTRAHSTSGWTAPAHASMFTGLYAASHGATQEGWILDQGFEALAERLQRVGYRTVGAVANPVVERQAGYAQGFEQYYEAWRMPGEVERDTRVVRWVERLLEDGDDGEDPRPLFLFVNLIGAHTPYDSCAEHCGAFGEAPGDGLDDSHWQDFYRGRRSLGEAELERLRRLYDAEILQVDANLGRLVDALERHRGLDDAVLLVTSDHGENLGDHGHVNHVFSLYESTTHVPLLLHAPGRVAPGRDERPAQLVDVYATLEAAGGASTLADEPASTEPGTATHRDLANEAFDLAADALAAGEKEAWTRVPLAEYYRPVQAFGALGRDTTAAEQQRMRRWWRRVRTVERDGWKLHWGSDGRHELYQLTSDPGERVDRAHDPAAAGELAALVALLEARLAALPPPPSASGSEGAAPGRPPAPDRATEEELRSLGYSE